MSSLTPTPQFSLFNYQPAKINNSQYFNPQNPDYYPQTPPQIFPAPMPIPVSPDSQINSAPLEPQVKAGIVQNPPALVIPEEIKAAAMPTLQMAWLKPKIEPVKIEFNKPSEIFDADKILANAEALTAQNKIVDAQLYIEKEMRGGPDNEKLFFYLAENLYKQRRFTKAKISYIKVCQLNPEHKEAHYKLGNIYLKLFEYDNAIDTFKKAIQIDPDRAYNHYKLGKTYYKKSKIYLERDKDGFFNIHKAKKSKEALELFTKAKEALIVATIKEPKQFRIYRYLGKTYIKLRNFSVVAIDAFDKAIELEPSHKKVEKINLHKAKIYFEMGEYDKSEEFFRKRLITDPKCFKAFYGLGQIYLKKNDFENAINCFLTSLSNNNYYSRVVNSKKSNRSFSALIDLPKQLLASKEMDNLRTQTKINLIQKYFEMTEPENIAKNLDSSKYIYDGALAALHVFTKDKDLAVMTLAKELHAKVKPYQGDEGFNFMEILKSIPSKIILTAVGVVVSFVVGLILPVKV